MVQAEMILKDQGDGKGGSEIEGFISQAIAANVPVETLERLLAMRDKIKAEQARDAFNADMAKFQGECPTIKKTKNVPTRSGAVAYSYAPLDSIVTQVKELLRKHGFSYAINLEMTEHGVRATCIAKHWMGHSETSSMEVPLGNKTEVMSQSQVVAAATTFAKRYAFCNAFGIMTGDEDSEVALQEKELKTAALTEFEDKLRAVKTLDELKAVWVSLPAMARKELETVKDEVKGGLQ